MPWELKTILGADIARRGLSRLNPLGHIANLLSPRPRLAYSKVAVLESAMYMRNQLLRDTDWASMAHSLEVRVPLVDAKLLSQVARITAKHGSMSKRMLGISPSMPLSTTGARPSEDRLSDSYPSLAAARQAHPGVAAYSHACR